MGATFSELDRCCNLRDDETGDTPRGHQSQSRPRRPGAPEVPTQFDEPDETAWMESGGPPLRIEVRLFNRTRVEDDVTEIVKAGADMRWIVLCMRPEEYCPFPVPLDVVAVFGIARKGAWDRSAETSQIHYETTSVSDLGDSGDLIQNLERAISGRRPATLRAAGARRALESIVVHASGDALALFSLQQLVKDSGITNGHKPAPQHERKVDAPLQFESVPLPGRGRFDSAGDLRDALQSVLSQLGALKPSRWVRHLLLLPSGDLLLVWSPSKKPRLYAVRELDLRSCVDCDTKEWIRRVGDWVSSPLAPAAGGRRVGLRAMKRLVGMLHWAKGPPDGPPAFLLAIYEEEEQIG